MKSKHPAIEHVLNDDSGPQSADRDRDRIDTEITTSLSLARALAIGCLSRLDASQQCISIWDPAAGSGLAGHMLVSALFAAGVEVTYRGQDIQESAVSVARRRFKDLPGIEIAVGDTLAKDEHEGFHADLVIVDAPWGMSWDAAATEVERRHQEGAFSFGLPQRNDSTWLFISLALEKLRPVADGGGRVAALVTPSALSAGGKSADTREAILAAGLLESVTRLPEALAPNTAVPLYLLTFASGSSRGRKDQTMIVDLQAQFTTEGLRRSITDQALQELESGLRTGKSGPRKRRIPRHHFTRHDASLVRTTDAGRRLAWRVTTYKDTPVDDQFLDSRYGPGHGVSLVTEPTVTIDLNPSRLFGDDTRELLADLTSKSWPGQRLVTLMLDEPLALKINDETRAGNLFIPTTRTGVVSSTLAGTGSDGRVLSIQLDERVARADFLAAWLNSELGLLSRRRAIDTGSTGAHLKALRSERSSLMRWADELILPLPPLDVQEEIAAADERLASFQAELSTRRASIWASPGEADAIVGSVAGAFDDSVASWLEQLPYPIATALWTAETAHSLGDKQLAYMHAWEAIIAFHATVLLSACRGIPGSGAEVEGAIRRTFDEYRLGLEKATLGTWIVIAEKVSSIVRKALDSADRDEVARVRTAFAGLSEAGIARLASKEVINKFNELNNRRNRWHGHSGYTSDDERQVQVDTLIADLRELRQLLGDVWTQLTLVRAGNVARDREGYHQAAEVALGTKSPFRKNTYRVGDPMIDRQLYLVRDGAEFPVPMLQFVQLRSAPRDAQYTTYFYNRTEGERVRLVSYQHGPESELEDTLASFRRDFGELWER